MNATKSFSFIALSLFVSLLIFGCNSSNNSGTNADTTVKNKDTIAGNNNSIATALPSSADTITSFSNAKFTHSDSIKYYVYSSNIYPATVSGHAFYKAYEKVENKDYIYLYFLFSDGKTKAIIAEGLDESHDPDPITLVSTSPPVTLTSDPNKPVGANRYWIRPSILYLEDLKSFLKNLKAEQVDLANGNYQINITPCVEKDNSNSSHTQYIGLTLSVKDISIKDPKAIKTILKTNPCPTCTQ